MFVYVVVLNIILNSDVSLMQRAIAVMFMEVTAKEILLKNPFSHSKH